MNIYIVLKEIGEYSDYSCHNLKAFAYKEDAEAFCNLQKIYTEKAAELDRILNHQQKLFYINNSRVQNKTKLNPHSLYEVENKQIKIENEAINKYNKDLDKQYIKLRDQIKDKFLLDNSLPLNLNLSEFSIDANYSIQELEIDYGILG